MDVGLHASSLSRLLVILSLLLPAVGFADPEEQAKTSTETFALSATTHFLEASLSEKMPTLLAGEKGELEVAFVVPEALWGDEPPGHLEVQVTAPKSSNVRFPTNEGESGGAELATDLVINIPLAPGRNEVVAKVPYDVESRVRVKNYNLRLYVSALTASATVAAAAGPQEHVRDSGLVTVPIRVETKLFTKVLVLVVIFFAIFMFVVEWVRVDVVAIMMMVGLPMLNLLSSKLTFTGLSSNAVVAIIGVMIVSAGLNKVGIVSRVVRPVIKAAGTSASKLMVFLSALIAVISSVMQNTGAAVLFLPGIRHACKEIKTPISSVLMPIGMCAILGGTLTMIGTSPLILLNDILPEGMEKFSLLELTPIGVAFVIGGIIYFSTVGKIFLKGIVNSQAARKGGATEVEETDVRSFYHELAGPFEMRVPEDFEPIAVVDIRRQYLTNIVGVADDKGLYELAPTPNTKISPGHYVCAYGPEESVKAFAEEHKIEMLERPRRFRDLFNQAVAGTVEAVVSSRSSIIGSTIKEIGFRKTFGVTSLALFREGKTYYKEMSDIPLQSGDALLLHAAWEHFHALQEAHKNFTIITPLEVEIQKPAKARAAVICFLIALTLMLVSSFYYQGVPYNPIPLSVCLMAGALGMVVTGVLSIRDAYSAVDWRTVFLLGGLIPLGMAVDRTGTAEWIATGIVAAMGDAVTPLILLTVLAVMSGAFCLVISNVGACTLLVPLGVSMAAQIGIEPRVAAIVVGIGVSNSFLLPTHQVNALYMGPGDYRTKDYMKIGGVLSLLYVTILVTMTYLFYV